MSLFSDEHIKLRIETPCIKIDDSFLALKREILKEIDNLMIEKKALENTLLTQANNESTIKRFWLQQKSSHAQIESKNISSSSKR